MTSLHLVPAQEADLGRYIDLLEEVADWLESRGIEQWRSGDFCRAAAFYAESIRQGEVQLALFDAELVGTLRVLVREPIVWPDIVEDDAVYVYTLAVRRGWRAHGFGGQMLQWAAERAVLFGRRFVRLDCMASNPFLAEYYVRAGFTERGEIDALFPPPVGTLRLKRYEKSVGPMK